MSAHDVAETPLPSPVRRLAGSAGVALVLKVVGAAVALAVQLLLARYLGAQQFGECVLVQSWLMVAVVLVKGGWEGSSARFVAEYSATGQQSLLRGFFRMRRQTVLTAALIAGVAIVIGLTILQAHLSPTLRISCWLMVLMIPLVAMSDLLSADLRARQKVFWADAPSLIGKPLVTLLLVLSLILLAQWPATSATAITAMALASAALLTVLLTRATFATASDRSLAPDADRPLWWSTMLPLWGVALCQLLMSQTDCIVMGFFCSARETGIYAAAARMANVIPLGLIAMNGVGAPLIAEQFALDRKQDLQRIATTMAGGALLITLPAMIGAIALGHYVLRAFGAEFEQGYLPLVILAVGQLVNALAGGVGQVLAMTGRQHVLARVLALASVGQVALTLLLVPLYGMLGAAIATTTIRMAWNIALAVVVWRRTGVNTTLFSCSWPAYSRV